MSFVEDETNSQMLNNTISSLNRISEILNHAGKFQQLYSELNNIVDTMNSSLHSYMKSSKRAILCDIFDGVISQIDFEVLQNRLKTDIKNSNKLVVPPYIPINIDLSLYSIEQYNSDIFVDMLANLEQKTIRKYSKLQKDAIGHLSDVKDSLTTFENDLCVLRTDTIDKMLSNVDMFYTIHANYVKTKLKSRNKKDVNLPSEITINGVSILMKDSQKEFIQECVRKLIGLKDK